MALMVDLQGPKLRLGTFKDGAAEIDTGQDFTLDGIVRLDRSEYFRMRQLHAVGVAWRRVGMPIRCGVTSVALRLVATREDHLLDTAAIHAVMFSKPVTLHPRSHKGHCATFSNTNGAE